MRKPENEISQYDISEKYYKLGKLVYLYEN